MSLQPPRPDSGLYSSWQAWASALLRHLQREREVNALSPEHQVPAYASTDLPSAEQAGLLIFIPDEDRVAISTSTGGWKRLRFVT